jgi:hypothetical protein
MQPVQTLQAIFNGFLEVTEPDKVFRGDATLRRFE